MKSFSISISVAAAMVLFSGTCAADMFGSGSPAPKAKTKAKAVVASPAPIMVAAISPDVGQSVSFQSTKDGSSLNVNKDLFDTAEARNFLATGKNPYIGRADAIEHGKKLYQMYSCTQCHGGNAQGSVGPNLHGPSFIYEKNATNKGMFETIWNGTNGGMGAKGRGLMDPTDPNNGLSPDEVLMVQAYLRSLGPITGN